MDDLVISTTTDSIASATAAANNDEAGARVPGPEVRKPEKYVEPANTRVDVFEHPRSERTMLLERLQEAEKELQDLAAPESETIITNEAEAAEEESAESPEGRTEQAGRTEDRAPSELDEAIKAAVRKAVDAQAIQAGIAAGQRQQPQLSPAQMALQQERARLLGAFQTRVQQLAKPEELQQKFAELQRQGVDNLSPEVYDAMLALRGGPETALHLLSNPAELKKINSMQPHVGAAYVAELAAKLTQPKRSVSAAPAPIKPVGGSATKSSVPMDELDYQDYRKARDPRERSFRR